MNNIIIDQVSLQFEKKVIFENLSLTLKSNCFTCLLGISGVGKSSLLKLIAGLYDKKNAIVSGSIYIEKGKAIHNIAWLAQHDNLFPWLTVIDNVAVGFYLRQSSFFKKKLPIPLKEKAYELLKRVGIDHLYKQRPNTLSGGEKQRVALARILFESGSIVLMDEPFAALDAVNRAILQEITCELLKDKTVILITHDPFEALRMGDVIYHLRGSPATFSEAINLTGNKPHSLEQQELLKMYAVLIDRLTEDANNSL